MGIKAIQVGHELKNLDQVRQELQEYIDILFGRTKSPLPENNVETLLELASAYYARGKEIEMKLHQLESNGVILKAVNTISSEQGTAFMLRDTKVTSGFRL